MDRWRRRGVGRRQDSAAEVDAAAVDRLATLEVGHQVEADDEPSGD